MALVITPVVQFSAAGQQGAKRALPSSSPTAINEQGLHVPPHPSTAISHCSVPAEKNGTEAKETLKCYEF